MSWMAKGEKEESRITLKVSCLNKKNEAAIYRLWEEQILGESRNQEFSFDYVSCEMPTGCKVEILSRQLYVEMFGVEERI